MAKPSPVMKHAKPKLTAEQIAIEEFMNSIPPAQVMEGSVLVDNTPKEWIDLPEGNLDSIVESSVVADSLDELADDVDGIKTATAFESYKRIFTNTLIVTGHPLIENVAFESFPQTEGGKKRLAKLIRTHAEVIRNCIKASFESYAEEASEHIDTTFKAFQQIMGSVNKAKSEIEVSDKITINQKKLIQLLHLNNKIVKSTSDVDYEVNAIGTLAKFVNVAVGRLERIAQSEMGGTALGDAQGEVYLMFNDIVKINNGRAYIERLAVEDTDAIELTGKELVGIIDNLRKIGPIIQNVVKDVEKIKRVIDSAPEGFDEDVKRICAPTLELALAIIRHSTEVLYGADSLVEKWAK